MKELTQQEIMLISGGEDLAAPAMMAVAGVVLATVVVGPQYALTVVGTVAVGWWLLAR